MYRFLSGVNVDRFAVWRLLSGDIVRISSRIAYALIRDQRLKYSDMLIGIAIAIAIADLAFDVLEWNFWTCQTISDWRVNFQWLQNGRILVFKDVDRGFPKISITHQNVLQNRHRIPIQIQQL